MIGPAAGALLAETRRRPGRLLLTGLAILVATVFAAGTLLLSETLRGYVAGRTQMTPTGAAAVVLPDRLSAIGNGADLVAAIGAVPGVDSAAGHWTAVLPVGGAGATSVWQIDSDPMAGPLTRLTAPLQGRLPVDPREVLIGKSTAARTGLQPGATLTVTPEAGPPRTVIVTGVVEAPLDGVNMLIGLPDAVGSLGAALDQIDVAADPGTDAATLVDGIGTAIRAPAAVRIAADQRLVEVESVSESVSDVLVGVGVFAGLALVAAAVVVASTFRIVLTQRRTQLALLRCVGARRGQVIRAVLAEAVVSGLVAGVLGVGVAILAGYGVIGTLQGVGVVDPPALVVPWPALAGCLLVAVLATVLAAVVPARAAARIPPVAALGSAGVGESGVPRAGRRLLAAGGLAAVAVAGAAGAVAMSAAAVLALIVLAASGMVAFAAIVAAGPVLVRALAATIGRAVAAGGRAPGRLATANATQVPRRTAATISVLALGVGLTSALLVALASTEAQSRETIAERFPADIVLDAPDAPALAQRLAGDPTLVVVQNDGQSVYVNPAPGTDEAAARRAVDAAVTGQPGVTVQYAADLRTELETTMFTMRMIGLALVGMTMLVAVVGVAVTLMLSVIERTRETGLLRAVGLTRRGVRAMVAWEAALSGAGAAVLGAVIGALYGVLGAQVLGVGKGFVAGSMPSLGGLVVGVVTLAVLAAVVPAVRAGRVPPIRALQDTTA